MQEQPAIEIPSATPDRGGTVGGRALRAAIRALRPHQWVKNALVPLPLLLAHVLPWHGPGAARQWLQAVAAFVGFCLAASAIYVVNDLRDLEADRAHPTKRRRPFASGALPTAWGLPIVAVLMAGVVGVCALLPPKFALVLALYVTLSVSYTLWLKRKMLVDVFVLAGLYTLRLLAGGQATSIGISQWLLAFSIFFFVSLAFAKRYSELHLLAAEGRTKAKGRNYTLDDLRIIEGSGPASGYLAVMVLALYINDASGAAGKLYHEPFFLWMLCPLLMYWITRVWFLAGRQMIDDDPILFAIKDRISWWTMLTALAFVLAAWQPWHAAV